MPITPYIQNTIADYIDPVMRNVSNNNGKVDDGDFRSMISSLSVLDNKSLQAKDARAVFSALRSITSTMSMHGESKSVYYRIIKDIKDQFPVKVEANSFKLQKTQELSDMYDFVVAKHEPLRSDIAKDSRKMSALAKKIPDIHLREDMVSIAKGDRTEPSYRLEVHNLSVKNAVIHQYYYEGCDLAMNVYSNDVALRDVNAIAKEPSEFFQENIKINDTHTEVYYSPKQEFLVNTANRLGYQEHAETVSIMKELELIPEPEDSELKDSEPKDFAALPDMKVNPTSVEVATKSHLEVATKSPEAQEEKLPTKPIPGDIEKLNTPVSSQKSSEIENKSGRHYKV